MSFNTHSVSGVTIIEFHYFLHVTSLSLSVTLLLQIFCFAEEKPAFPRFLPSSTEKRSGFI